MAGSSPAMTTESPLKRHRFRLHGRTALRNSAHYDGKVMFFLKSITRRIVFLHVITISITSAFMPVALYLLLKSSAEDLLHRSLRENAKLIARYLTARPDGSIVLSLPPDIGALFSDAYGRYAYSVTDASGR